MADFPSTGAGLGTPVIPVSLLNRLAREQPRSRLFHLCWVAGEVSNLSHASSGHIYFLAQGPRRTGALRHVPESRATARLATGERPAHRSARAGDALRGPRGEFPAQRRSGPSRRYRPTSTSSSSASRKNSNGEGLFDSAGKRPLPAFPRRDRHRHLPAGSGAARRAERRSDAVPARSAIVVYPTPVQGDGAAAARSPQAIRERRRASGMRTVLIVCRGGGSIEDLWAFNDEAVARAIRSCSLPVISGIGHETDFTIADFAADQRAPTPTAAAELAAPERSRAARSHRRQSTCTLRRHRSSSSLNQRGQQLDWLAHRLQHPAQYLARHHDNLRQPAAPPRRGSAAGQRCARAPGLDERHPSPAADPPRSRVGRAGQPAKRWRQRLNAGAWQTRACVSQGRRPRSA
jgi:exodeoxyribonuclease VII large subunit